MTPPIPLLKARREAERAKLIKLSIVNSIKHKKKDTCIPFTGNVKNYV